MLGNILVNQERYKEASSVYQEALKFDPMSFELNYNLGIVHTMLNDFQNAKEYYEKAAEINSLSFNSKYSLAEIALIYKELEEAEQLFLEAVEDPELEADAYYELAKICLIRGEKEKAINFANIAIESNPKKIADKIQNNMMFMPIYAKLTIPFNLDAQIKESNIMNKLTRKEIIAKEHLEEMFELIRKIGYDDIKLFNQYLKNEKQGKEEILEKQYNLQEQKERLD
ncbi:photosystem I assembly protein Ycf3 [compost metagenome]